ncbi:dehydration-responsive element-binding protein 1E-like [Prosopis cineraria]|uniref:dehydration-responsive element-binding protein 1E-like n=1 Tax=Prosopis cineraria TaxID=364024 RepID=UPI00240EC630|nr:dehydration-responsive element-binding protein 1E-like [Prosopis cineraria]
MAARAHDVTAMALHGKSTCLNFADSSWRLPLPESTNSAEIRRVAALAAQEFGRRSSTDDVEVCSSCSNATVDDEVIGDASPSNILQDYCEEEEPYMIKLRLRRRSLTSSVICSSLWRRSLSDRHPL